MTMIVSNSLYDINLIHSEGDSIDTHTYGAPRGMYIKHLYSEQSHHDGNKNMMMFFRS